MLKKFKNFQRSVGGSHYTALSYDVNHGAFVLFTFAKVKVSTLISDQSLALLHVSG